MMTKFQQMSDAFYSVNTTRSVGRGFTIKFFQDSKNPLQIIRDSTDSLILPITKDKKLSIEVKNRSFQHKGIIVTIGGYNLAHAGSIRASSTFDEGIYEAKPKETIMINKRYQNMLTKEGEKDLILTEDHLSSYLCIYYKSGNPLYYGNQNQIEEPDCIEYKKKAKHMLSVKLVTLEKLPTDHHQLIAA